MIINKILNRVFNLKSYRGLQIHCRKEHYGTEYGGWYVCPDVITSDSVVYSFGVGEDISFDLEMIERFGCTVYAFDPTPKSIEWIQSQKLPDRFHFFAFGIAGYDGIAKFNPPENPEYVSYTMLDRPGTYHNAIEAQVYRLQSIMSMLGHQKIDVLKVDIEGAEYGVIEDLTKTDIKIEQLLIEFHHRFENIGISKTRRAIELLKNKGLRYFYVSPNKEEYSFIRVD